MTTKNQYLWNLLGTIGSTAISILLLLLSSRLLIPAQADLFSIAYTIAQQLLIIGIFGVRPYQSTDVAEQHAFSDYFWTRLLTLSAMFLSLLAYLFWAKVPEEKFWVILLLTAVRGVDALSDVFQGYFQQHHRSDLAGKILSYRSLGLVLSFALVLSWSKNLIWSSASMLLVNLLLLAYDWQSFRLLAADKSFVYKGKQVKAIIFHCWPLFVNAFLINYIFSEPRLVIDKLLGEGQLEAGVQRNFSVLFMPTFALNLLFLILRPLLTQLAGYWQEQKTQRFYQILTKICLMLVALEALLLVLGYAIGTSVLSFVFGLELTALRLPLFILLVGGGLNLFASLIDNIMVIYRGQKYLIVANIVTFIAAKILTAPLIQSQGLLGAAISFCLTMMIYFLTSLVIYWLVVRQRRKC